MAWAGLELSCMNYDDVASEYDRRYAMHEFSGIASTLLSLRGKGTRVLELGCGSGHWLRAMAAAGFEVAGIDPSQGMLDLASNRVRGDLRRGRAEELPWPDGSFDAVFAVNALHHFVAPAAAAREAFRVLRGGGTFLSIGLDPHAELGRWYVYEFFPETIHADRERLAPESQRIEWLRAAGFVGESVRPVERIRTTHALEEATRSGILAASFTSQLTALTEAQYSAGLKRLHDAARETGDAFRLEVDLVLYATEARRPELG
jgi:ubiquinone/menaquinone biosynthesis C-methylase UbiE